MIITLFARKEQTRDPLDRKLGFGKRMDTILYRDKECTQRKVVWPWHYRDCPDRRYKSVMVNCYRWRLEWLPPLNGEQTNRVSS